MQKIKKEVETLLGFEITEELFKTAYSYAERKQKLIYEQQQKAVVLEKWYLIQLTMEHVKSLVFSEFSLGLIRTMCNMEKEHPFTEQGTPQANHIVPVSV